MAGMPFPFNIRMTVRHSTQRLLRSGLNIYSNFELPNANNEEIVLIDITARGSIAAMARSLTARKDWPAHGIERPVGIRTIYMLSNAFIYAKSHYLLRIYPWIKLITQWNILYPTGDTAQGILQKDIYVTNRISRYQRNIGYCYYGIKRSAKKQDAWHSDVNPYKDYC